MSPALRAAYTTVPSLLSANPMRPITPLLAALAFLGALAGCGTKTPLTLPPQQPPAKAAALPTTSSMESMQGLALADSRRDPRAGPRQ
jgi:predicted small lipoprotein YifL